MLFLFLFVGTALRRCRLRRGCGRSALARRCHPYGRHLVPDIVGKDSEWRSRASGCISPKPSVPNGTLPYPPVGRAWRKSPPSSMTLELQAWGSYTPTHRYPFVRHSMHLSHAFVTFPPTNPFDKTILLPISHIRCLTLQNLDFCMTRKKVGSQGASSGFDKQKSNFV